MKKSKIFSLSIQFFLFAFLITKNCDLYASNIKKEATLESESCDEYKKENIKMEKIYQKILKEYKEDEIFIKKMKIAQKAWLSFRSAHIDAIFPNSNTGEYGSVYTMCNCDTLTQMTKNRIKELNQWKTGIEEGDVCSGSRKTRN